MPRFVAFDQDETQRLTPLQEFEEWVAGLPPLGASPERMSDDASEADAGSRLRAMFLVTPPEQRPAVTGDAALPPVFRKAPPFDAQPPLRRKDVGRFDVPDMTDVERDIPLTRVSTSEERRGGPKVLHRPAVGDATDYVGMARAAATKHGVDPDIFERQIRQESGYAPDVVSGRRKSSAGAEGIAQIMRQYHPTVDPLDPSAALDYAAKLMASHLKSYGGDYARALAAYNAGPGAVNRYGGVPPFEETQRYIKTILGKDPPPPVNPSGKGTEDVGLAFEPTGNPLKDFETWAAQNPPLGTGNDAARAALRAQLAADDEREMAEARSRAMVDWWRGLATDASNRPLPSLDLRRRSALEMLPEPVMPSLLDPGLRLLRGGY